MISNIGFKNKLVLLEEKGTETKFQILKYESLKGAKELDDILKFNALEASGRWLKQVRISMKDSTVIIQDNALSYIKGYIKQKNVTKINKGVKKLIFDRKSQEKQNIKMAFNGTGEILLNPSFNDFTLIELIDEQVIIDDDIFIACDEELNISLNRKSSIGIAEKNIRNELMIKGNGVIVLELPVPGSEIIRCKMLNDKLIVADDLVILRNGSIKYSMQNIQRYIDEEVVEESVCVYYGIGEVWLLPTRKIYNKYDKISCNYNYEEDEYR